MKYLNAVEHDCVLNAVIEAIGDPVYVKDLECRFILANSAAIATMAISSQEKIIGKLPHDVFSSDSAEKVLQDDRRIMETGQAQTFEETLTFPSGKKRVFLTTKSPHRDTSGKIIGLIGISRDITEKKQIEEDLKDSEERFRGAFEQSPFSTQLLSADGRTVEVNPAWKRLWKIDQATIDNFIFKEYRILEDQQLVAKGIMPYIKQGFSGEDTTIPPILYDPQELGMSGRPRWVEGHIYPVKDAHGHIQQVVLTHNDVTDIKEAEERFRLIFEFSPAALIMSDDHGIISLANSRTEILLGYGRTELIGKPIELLVPERFHVAHVRQRDQFTLESTARQMGAGRDLFALRKDGAEIPVEIALTPVKTDKGNFVLSTVIDISERKRAEQEKERLYQEAQQAIRLRDDFLSIASHELKTPLTSLGMQVQLLNRMAEQGTLANLTKEKASALFKVSKQQLERFSTLINDLLDASRISAGRLTLHIESIELSELLRDLIKRFEAELNSAACSVNIRADIPIIGSWDRMRIEQIITNILSNAMKYGAGKPIEITAKLDSGKAIISIQDHGIGIAKEDQARIFERFERAVSPKNFGGLGLGLFITRQIIEAHGGTIRVESEPSKGSVFTVELPIKSSEIK